MKTPIAFEDIRVGDKVEVEWDEPAPISGFTFVRLVATCDGQRPNRAARAFLLDRPAPAVELPTEPTLGWLTLEATGFFAGSSTSLETVWLNDAKTGLIHAGRTALTNVDRVKDFTPATAVPTSALDELRANYMDTSKSLAKITGDFLDAIDAAGDPR